MPAARSTRRTNISWWRTRGRALAGWQGWSGTPATLPRRIQQTQFDLGDGALFRRHDLAGLPRLAFHRAPDAHRLRQILELQVVKRDVGRGQKFARRYI